MVILGREKVILLLLSLKKCIIKFFFLYITSKGTEKKIRSEYGRKYSRHEKKEVQTA